MSEQRDVYDYCEFNWCTGIPVRYLLVPSHLVVRSNHQINIFSLLLRTPSDTLEENHVRYFATFCITSGTYTSISLTIAWCKYIRSTLPQTTD